MRDSKSAEKNTPGQTQSANNKIKNYIFGIKMLLVEADVGKKWN